MAPTGGRFEIRRVGETIIDPDTGAPRGDETAVGLVEITKVINERLSLARALEGSSFQVGGRALMK